MKEKLLKIARYLGQNGFHKEAQELEELTDKPKVKTKAISFMERINSEYSKDPEKLINKLINLKVVIDVAAKKDSGWESVYGSKNYVGWTQDDFKEAKGIVEKEIKAFRIKELKKQIEKLQAELLELEK